MVEKINFPSFSMEAVDILEFTSRQYVDKKGVDRVFSTALVRIDGKVLKFSVAKELDLRPYEGKQVSLKFELQTWGDDLSPSVRIVDTV